MTVWSKEGISDLSKYRDETTPETDIWIKPDNRQAIHLERLATKQMLRQILTEPPSRFEHPYTWMAYHYGD